MAAFPQHLTHYFYDRPFRTISDVAPEDRAAIVDRLAIPANAVGRLRSAFYFEQRDRYEAIMREQFVAKGGAPTRRRPHYAILGESELWAEITPRSIRVPLAAIPSAQLSFTYTDSWSAFVDRDLAGGPIPRKPAYGKVYRLEELDAVFAAHGWPGERWKTEPEWEHDLYVEAQLWSDEPLAAHQT